MAMASSNRAQLMRDGYLVKRDVIPPSELASLRVTFETLLDRQRAVWRRERGPDDPPGGIWDSAMQPRLSNTETFIDADTAEAVEIWVSEPDSRSGRGAAGGRARRNQRDADDVQPHL